MLGTSKDQPGDLLSGRSRKATPPDGERLAATVEAAGRARGSAAPGAGKSRGRAALEQWRAIKKEGGTRVAWRSAGGDYLMRDEGEIRSWERE